MLHPQMSRTLILAIIQLYPPWPLNDTTVQCPMSLYAETIYLLI